MPSGVYYVHISKEGRGQRGAEGECNRQMRSSADPCAPRAGDLQ